MHLFRFFIQKRNLLFIILSVIFISHFDISLYGQNQTDRSGSFFVSLKQCGTHFPIPAGYTVLEKESDWFVVQNSKAGIFPEYLLIATCDLNIERTSSLGEMQATSRFRGKPASDFRLFSIMEEIPALVFRGSIEFRNELIMTNIVYFDTRDYHYTMFNIPLKGNTEDRSDELVRIASSLQFNSKPGPAISESDLTMRIWLLVFAGIILAVGLFYLYKNKFIITTILGKSGKKGT